MIDCHIQSFTGNHRCTSGNFNYASVVSILHRASRVIIANKMFERSVWPCMIKRCNTWMFYELQCYICLHLPSSQDKIHPVLIKTYYPLTCRAGLWQDRCTQDLFLQNYEWADVFMNYSLIKVYPGYWARRCF